MFRRVDALVQTFGRIGVQHWHGLLADDRTGIHARIHKMHRAAGHLHAALQRLLPRGEARKRRQQRRMDVHNAAFERA